MKLSKSKEYLKYPKFKYEKEDDVLNIWLSDRKIDYGDQTGDIIVHFTEDEEPVYIEILDASKFLKRQAEDLPKEVKQKFFASSS